MMAPDNYNIMSHIMNGNCNALSPTLVLGEYSPKLFDELLRLVSSPTSGSSWASPELLFDAENIHKVTISIYYKIILLPWLSSISNKRRDTLCLITFCLIMIALIDMTVDANVQYLHTGLQK